MTDWTIMVYISADNVLANYAIESLNQLRRAGDGIAVVAQFDGGGKRPYRLTFDGKQNSDTPLERIWSEIHVNMTGTKIHDVNMTDSATLTEFVNAATDGCEASHYALVLWGHGTELLLDQDPSTSGPRYLTPAKLKKALKHTRLATDGKKLDIIGFDACNMSMVELAYELQDCADFMIASQEEVPDAGFPYDQLLARLKHDNRGDVAGICRMIPKVYKQAFQDYLVTPDCGVSGITLSSLNLGTIRSITDPLKELANALMPSTSEKNLREAIVSARRRSRDFVLGLFVDLYDFCNKLGGELVDYPLVDQSTKDKLTSASQKICKAISERTCVIDNQTGGNGKDCNGLSIYFPYSKQGNEDEQNRRLLGEEETGIINLPLLLKDGTNNPRKARSARIEELEADFKHLDGFRKTGWLTFIEHGWSVLLAQKFPNELDLHYSAEQCALNLLSLVEEGNPISLPKAS